MCRQLRSEYKDNDKFREAWQEWQRGRKIPRSTLEQVLDHIDHIRQIARSQQVGLGADYDEINSTPRGPEDVSCFPSKTQGLAVCGCPEEDNRDILGNNVLRVFRCSDAWNKSSKNSSNARNRPSHATDNP